MWWLPKNLALQAYCCYQCAFPSTLPRSGQPLWDPRTHVCSWSAQTHTQIRREEHRKPLKRYQCIMLAAQCSKQSLNPKSQGTQISQIQPNHGDHFGKWVPGITKKVVFNPNRNTWAKTAKCMGASKAPKQKCGLTGGNTSIEHISPVKCKHACKYSDPYTMGKRSGKCAKPDMVCTTTNKHAHTAVPAPAPPFSSMLSPICMSPSTAIVGSAECSFTCADQSTTGPPAYLSLGTVLGFVFAPLSTALPRYMFVLLSTTVL